MGVHLTEEDCVLLKSILTTVRSRDEFYPSELTFPFDRERFSDLLRNRFIVDLGTGVYAVPASTIEAIKAFDDNKLMAAKDRKKENGLWIRWWVTTAIAVAAFIKSFFF